MNETTRIVRYIKANMVLGLYIPTTNELWLMVVYYDSDWVSYPMIQKSVRGYCVQLESAMVSWKSKKANHNLSVQCGREI